MLEMSQLRFAHPGRSPTLDRFDLELGDGQAVLLEGPSGCGKSTVLRLATGLIPAVQGGRIGGEVRVDGTPVEKVPPAELPRRIGYVPQDPETAFVARTVRRELSALLANAGVAGPERSLRIEQTLHAFGAGHLAEREIATLSGGEAARVALAAALVAEPGLLVFDEPHAQLDARARRELAGTLRALRAGGRSILLAAHEPHPFDGTVDRTIPLGTEPDRDDAPPLPDPVGGDPLLELDRVRHRYGEDQPPIGPVDLAIEPGEIVALEGPNGSGKTTALHAACGLLDPSEGSVRLLGADPRRLAPEERARRVGIAFQHPAWHITQDTLREEVALTGDEIGRETQPEAVLAKLGLSRLADVHPWDLSGGERQRMAVATALAHDPEVLLLDEPTRGLDPRNRDRLARLLEARCEAGKATLIASHHPWMAELAHRTVELADPTPTREPDPDRAAEVVYA